MLNSFSMVSRDLLLKSSLILLAGFAASVAAHRASAALRHFIGVLALAGVLILPALEVFLPAWRFPAGREQSIIVTQALAVTRPSGIAQPPQSAPSRQDRIATIAFAVWIAGVMICVRRWRNGAGQVARLRRQSQPSEERLSALVRELTAELRLSRAVSVLVAGRDIMPMSAGVLRPAIFLPPAASHWSPERLRMVLLHELAHIQRNDCLAQAMAELAFCIYWFHPLVWLAVRRLRVERERASDDLVLRAGNRPSDYAAHLLDLARSAVSCALPVSAIPMAASSHLESRLRAILQPRRNRHALSPLKTVVACLAAASLVVPLAAMRPQAHDARIVSGTVYDPSGAVVPQAIVIVTNSDRGQKQTTTTDQAGQFSIGPLGNGKYRLEIDARGFAPRLRYFAVDGTHQLNLDVTVDLGHVEENLVVRGKGTPAPPSAAPHRIRVGGNVTPAKLVYQAKPEYPEDIKSRGITGDVVLHAVISKEGMVISLASVSSPDPALTDAAMKAVRQWRYEPSLLNGEPVETATTITVNFELEP